MDSIYYVLIIIGISFGLIALYIILRSMKVIGAVPILSDIVDPILFGPRGVVFTYKTKENRRQTETKIAKHVQLVLKREANVTSQYYEEDNHFEIDMTKAKVIYDKETGDYYANKIRWRAYDPSDGETVSDYLSGDIESEVFSISGNLKTGVIEDARDPRTFETDENLLENDPLKFTEANLKREDWDEDV